MSSEAEFARALAGFPAVRRVYLFGSRARGDARERSDVDIAVEAPSATPREWLAIEDAVAAQPTLLHFDVVRLEEAPAALRERILEEGRLLLPREALERAYAAGWIDDENLWLNMLADRNRSTSKRKIWRARCTAASAPTTPFSIARWPASPGAFRPAERATTSSPGTRSSIARVGCA